MSDGTNVMSDVKTVRSNGTSVISDGGNVMIDGTKVMSGGVRDKKREGTQEREQEKGESKFGKEKE